VQNVGDGMAVVYRDAKWQFRGDLLPISIHANAAAQRNVRVDDPSASPRYSRALQFDIAVAAGVACAQVSQHAADGSPVTVAYFKVHEPSATRMSLWTTDSMGNAPSTDPSAGATRSNDDTWVTLPEGAAGDDVIRNFYRGGRTVTVALFSDAACATPATIGGKSAFDVDVQGVPPVWSAMPSMPWGELTAGAKGALQSLALANGVAGELDVAWTFADGSTGFDETEFCTNGACGDGSVYRIGAQSLRPGSTSAAVALRGPVGALAAGDFKELILGGRDGSGMNVESEFVSCTSRPAGSDCMSN